LYNLGSMTNIKHSSKEFENVGFVQLSVRKNTICKMYDLYERDVDGFGKTPTDYYNNESYFYQQLNNMTYIAGNGQEMRLTPKCLEIGKNYILLEKYDTSMLNQIKKGGLFEHYKELNAFVNLYVIPIAKKLDQLKIIHDDFYPRNIVFDLDFTRCSVIDFGLSSLCKKPVCRNNINSVMSFKNDTATNIFYPEMKEHGCNIQ
jgi:serine/threonine protein kinase